MPTMTGHKRATPGRVVTVLSVIAAVIGHAATDGVLGPTSTGTMTLTATVPAAASPPQASITGIRDLVLPALTFDGVSGRAEAQICIFHSTPTYSVTVSQPGAADLSPLKLAGPNGDSLALRVGVGDPRGNGVDIPAAGTIRGMSGNRQSPTCADGDRSTLYAKSSGDASGTGADIDAGVYSGIVLLLIAPE